MNELGLGYWGYARDSAGAADTELRERINELDLGCWGCMGDLGVLAYITSDNARIGEGRRRNSFIRCPFVAGSVFPVGSTSPWVTHESERAGA